MVFFEAPHRLGDVLADMADLWDAGRPAAVCRELTKIYEEVRRGSVAELAEWASQGVRGEVTLVVAGASPSPLQVTDDRLREQVQELMASGLSRKDAVSAVAERTGTPRRRVYNVSL